VILFNKISKEIQTYSNMRKVKFQYLKKYFKDEKRKEKKLK